MNDITKHFLRLVRGTHRSPVVSLTKAGDTELWYFFDLHLNKRLSKQTRRRRLGTPLHSLWSHCNVNSLGGRILNDPNSTHLKVLNFPTQSFVVTLGYFKGSSTNERWCLHAKHQWKDYYNFYQNTNQTISNDQGWQTSQTLLTWSSERLIYNLFCWIICINTLISMQEWWWCRNCLLNTDLCPNNDRRFANHIFVQI